MESQSGSLVPARGPSSSLCDMPLICLNCDSVTVPVNDTVEYSPALLEIWVSPEYLFFLDIMLTRNSTAVRCPPIVMSSPCTVATTSSLLMRPLHTHGHALPLVNPRPLSVDASSSSQFCAASRVPYRLYRSSPHMCSSPGWAAIQQTPLFVLARKSTPSARRPMLVPFPHVRPLRSQTARFSAPPMAVSTHTARVWRVSCFLCDPSRAHVRLPWLPLVGLCPLRLGGGLSSFA